MRVKLNIEVAEYAAWDTAHQHPTTRLFPDDYVELVSEDESTITIRDGDFTAQIPRAATGGAPTVEYQDKRRNNGGAGRGQGRVGDVVKAAYRIQQLTARVANRNAMTASERMIVIASLQAAIRDLQKGA